jgi:hypothetical protein
VNESRDELPAASWRRRALVLLLALATASTVMALLIWRPGDPKRGTHPVERPLPSASASAPAPAGVGGPAQVRLLPASAASTPAR